MSNTQATQVRPVRQAVANVGTLLREFLGQGRYDPRSFYVATQDSKGHNDTSTIRHPPSWARAISIAVENMEAYRTKTDFWRNAGYHQIVADMDYLDQQGKLDEASILYQIVEQERKLHEMAQVKERALAFQRTFQEAKETLLIHIDQRDDKAINEMMHWVEDQTENPHIPPGVRDDYEDLLDEMTAMLLKLSREEKRALRAKTNND